MVQLNSLTKKHICIGKLFTFREPNKERYKMWTVSYASKCMHIMHATMFYLLNLLFVLLWSNEYRWILL